MKKNLKFAMLLTSIILFLSPTVSIAQADKLKQRLKNNVKNFTLVEAKSTDENLENNQSSIENSSTSSQGDNTSSNKTGTQLAPEGSTVTLPEYFSKPSHQFDDKEITEEKIFELFKRYERDCEEILKIWIGDLDRSEEWHTFKHDTGIPDFMRTNRYFSIVFKAKDGKCYYTWNNLALSRDYEGGGKFSEMKLISVKYKKIEIDCAEVR